MLLGDPVSTKVTGLTPCEEASLRVSCLDRFENTWSSQATFRADEAGTVETSRDVPTEGSYQGVDQAGPFWPMTCTPDGRWSRPSP